jgi:hypothetical protein
MARRNIIKRALLCSEADWPFYEDALQKLVSNDVGSLNDRLRNEAEARIDWQAAQRHIAEGTRLMEGLWRSKAERQRLGLQ